MAGSTYTYFVDALGYGQDERTSVNNQSMGLVNQTSPSWVLTFVRWENRDTLRDTIDSPIAVRQPIVVDNDCLSVDTVQEKGVLTPSMTATLVMTDINYETAIAPGDFVFVNVLNWPEDARRVALRARNLQPINGINDGFKGIFKVQSVFRNLSVDPESGTRTVLFSVTGFAFTEFNNHIYFNPYLLNTQDTDNLQLFSSLVGVDFNNLINRKAVNNIQDIIAMLIQSFIGTGIQKKELGLGVKPPIVSSQNVHFLMPTMVGKLLGVPSSGSNLSAKDIYLYTFGIQSYAGGSVQSLSQGMNPLITSQPYGSNFFYTNNSCEGVCLLAPSYWNDVPAWSILNEYTNSPLNELYTCFRVAPTLYNLTVGTPTDVSVAASGSNNSGQADVISFNDAPVSAPNDQNSCVMPTMVFRQIPFTNEDFPQSNEQFQRHVTPNTTKFMSLPRWKIDPALILSENIGRDEAARFNFMQYFGRSTFTKDGADIAREIAAQNYVFDIDDVKRSGLRPSIANTQFDELVKNKVDYRSPLWAYIMGDAIIGGQLKLSGTIVSSGIVPPITVGDNLELDGVVYHIERVMHSCRYQPLTGFRSFRTILSLSHGISATSSPSGTRYAEMTNTNAYSERQTDHDNNQTLPGISESQTSLNRTAQNPDPSLRTLKGINLPFPQPANKNGSGGGGSNTGQG